MAFLLVAGVIFILAQTMGIVGTRSMDTSQQLDSTAALMLAESGLQRAEAMVGRVGNSGTMAEGDCTGIATGGPFALGRGSFSYSAPVAEPPGCTAGLCNTCSVGVTGTVGSAARTLSQKYILGVSNGVAGRGTTVTMVLRNIHDVPATSLFNMAWKRQDAGGNADATFCANGASDCGLQWNLESSNGNTSVGGMGVTVDIPANTISKVVVQTLSQSRDYVEVGGLFPSRTPAYPTIVGRFWDDKHPTNLTGVNAGSTGGVVNGVAPTTGACTTSPSTYPTGGTGSFQLDTCTQWCTASDTLVYGISGRSATSSDQLNTVTFGTNGPSPVAMTKLVHFPNLDGSTPNASGKAFSEIWYAYNQEYTSAAANTGAGLTSYPSAVKATAGALMTLDASISNGDITVTGSITGNPVCPGDMLVKPGDTTGSTISLTPSGGTCYSSSATGTFTISSWTGGNVNKNSTMPQVWGRTLAVTGQTGDNFAAGTATVRTNPTSSITISSGPSGGNYTLSAPAYIGSTTYVTQGANSTTIRVPTGSTLPGTAVALPKVSVYAVNSSPAGTGTFASGTTVLSVGADSFTVSAVPSNGLYGASVCGGICAFFKSPSDPAANNVTQFTVVKSGGTTQFASGFVCLRGVDQPKIAPVTSTTLTTSRWQEVVN
jgi:hypothetical protein